MIIVRKHNGETVRLQPGCYADAALGWDHVRGRLAKLVEEFLGDSRLSEELGGEISDDASEELEAIDKLNKITIGGVWSLESDLILEPMTEYLQGDDAQEFLQNGYCEECLKPASEWAEEDQFGNVEVFGAYDGAGNLVGFLCPDCAWRD